MDAHLVETRSDVVVAARKLRLDLRVIIVPLLVTTAAAVGVALRGYGLSKGLWFDEAYSFWIARQPLLDVPRLLRVYDTHPPFYYMLLHVWMAIAGQTEAAIRIPSALAGAVLIPLTFLLARRLSGATVGVLAAGIVASSPYLIAASQEARMYSFLGVFTLGATYALLLGLEEGRRRYWVAYAALMVLAVYTHHFALLVLLAHAVYLVATLRHGPALKWWLACVLVIVIAYLPLLPSLPPQVTTVRSWPSIRPPLRLSDLVDVLAMWSFGGGLFGTATYFRKGFYSGVIPETCVLSPLRFTDPSPPKVCLDQPAYPLLALIPFILLVLTGVSRLERRGRLLILACWLVPFLIVALISLQWNFFQKRYFSFLTPFFSVLVAAGILQTVHTVRHIRPVAAAAGLLAFLGAYTIPALFAYFTAPPTHDWRAAAAYVRQHASREDVLLFMPAFTRLPFEYYFHGDQATVSINPREILKGRQVVGFRVEADSRAIAALALRHPRLWIVAAAPIGVEGRHELLQQVPGSFREAAGVGFGYVYVFRWDSQRFTPATR
ncbi:MAG: glycosyltransferase family 39 protein [Armatimonadota bacterium]|nr:glycosyltransferase family 39 protein [Armatimonadota bacterium]MDR7427661.1 glycosyltransferase family 39 protein [Armatimonadota bacterium]MDR7463727.1 glycosyltransferase family 39 protein [Armatimonadota bacterium]MDR7470180.1 glycosyltransferase family 39 protein [Armatimonadota bacterium]MDR7473608.1 glycosyltransferase family 39 protein [Armatimonadota bacterium]